MPKIASTFSVVGELALPMGLLTATSSWQPTLPLVYVGNFTTLPVITDGTTTVRFRFTPQGLGGGWRIDDVYVDPYKGR